MLALTYGMMPSAKIDRLPKRPSAEHVEEAEEARALLVDDRVHHGPVDAGDRDEDADAVDRQQHHREQDAPAELGHLADVGEGGEGGHGAALGATRSRYVPARARREQDDLAAGLLDLLGGGLGERVRRDGHGLGELAVAEDLDAVVAALHEAALARAPSRRPSRRRAKTSRSPTLTSAVIVGNGLLKPRFGRRRWMRRLPALEVRLEPARARVLALLAATGRLAEAGADAAAEARLRAGRAGGLRELAQRVSH